MTLFDQQDSIIQRYKVFKEPGIIVDIKREDLLHDQVSGNKLRKLKYNLLWAQRYYYKTIVTYGGAFSNHIAATATAGKILGLKTIGVIRGDELGIDLEKTLSENATLKSAYQNGMHFLFVTREEYRLKGSKQFHDKYIDDFDSCYYEIPEGGTNQRAVAGCEEILTESDKENYDIICVAAGTGGTAAGIINSVSAQHHVYVFAALKGGFMRNEILKFTDRTNFTVINETNFGGYARSNDELIEFINLRFRESGIPLEPIYTAKMMYGIEQLINTNVISKESRILAIHTGGLQGITGYNEILRKKGRKLITYEGQF